ncbi:cupin domain-containing protein [Streptomyces sp. NPDC008121]|uniref:cupin domain-containing protein n=1 Tax=Streptomyces sp. NPDC008121 TaxID=3364809 RepID=UPI0036F08F2A
MMLGPRHEITVFERRAPGSAYGFGVVLSDTAMSALAAADPQTHQLVAQRMIRWDHIDVHREHDHLRASGQGFGAVDRRTLLAVLRSRAASLGVRVHDGRQAPRAHVLSRKADLVVAADGAGSQTRDCYSDIFMTTVTSGPSRYIWLGSTLPLPAFAFYFLDTPHGLFRVHSYPYEASKSTFVVETDETAWSALRKAASNWPAAPGPDGSDPAAVAFCRQLLAPVLNGHPLFHNSSQWLSFPTVHTRRWHHGNIVLLGDAAHTSHYSVGSGTQLALADALALATRVHGTDDLAQALDGYEAERRPAVERRQQAAQASADWFADARDCLHQPPEQFAFSLLTRTGTVSADSLARRDAGLVETVRGQFAEEAAQAAETGAPAGRETGVRAPLRLRQLLLQGRTVTAVPWPGCGPGPQADLGQPALVLAETGSLSCAQEALSALRTQTGAPVGISVPWDPALGHEELDSQVRTALGAQADLIELAVSTRDAPALCRAVRRTWPQERPLSLRVHAGDGQLPGLAREHLLSAAAQLAGLGCDVLNLSDWDLRTAGQVRLRSGVPVMTPCAPRQAETLLLAGRADLVLDRPAARTTRLPAAAGPARPAGRDEGEHMNRPLVLGPGEGLDWSRAAEAVTHRTVQLKIGGDRTDGRFSFLESELFPGDQGPPVHRHPRSDEAFYLLSGQLRLLLGDHEVLAQPGSFIFVPRGVAHAFTLEGDVSARLLGLFSPAGFEQFHADIAAFYRRGQTPGPELIRQTAARYDWEYVGPPMHPRSSPPPNPAEGAL